MPPRRLVVVVRRRLAVAGLLLALPVVESRGLSSGPAFVNHHKPPPALRRTTSASKDTPVLSAYYESVLPGPPSTTKSQRSFPTFSTPNPPPSVDLSLQATWTLAPDEEIKLQHLQEALIDLQDHPKFQPIELIRYLKQFNDVHTAETKFRDMVQWRDQHHVDSMLESYHPPSLFRYFPAGVLQGVDRDGDPIHVERTGAADSPGLLQRYGRDEMIQQAIWLREVQCHGSWTRDYEQEHGHPVQQFTIVMDMQGLSMRHLAPSLVAVGQQVSRIVQDYYPGYTKRIIIIRAPAIFQLGYNAMKPFIDADMREKVIVAGSHDYGRVLKQYLDLSVLPPQLHPEGKGAAVQDFGAVVWEGGKIPDHEEELAPLLSSFVKNPAVEERKQEQEPSSVTEDEIAIYQQSKEKTKNHTRLQKWLNQQLDTFQCLDGGYFGHPPYPSGIA